MAKRLIAATLALLALGGCAELLPPAQPPAPPPAAAQPAPAAQEQGVTISKEQGGRFLALVGPRVQYAEPFLGVRDTNFSALRSWLDNKTGEMAHQVYVETSYYGGPYRWDAARDENNTTLRFIRIASNEITCELGCSYADEIAAALPEDYLRAHRGGFGVSFASSQGKTLTVPVSAGQVATQLDAIDAVRAAAKSAAGPPAAIPAAAAAAPPGAPPNPAPTSGLAPGTVVPPPPAPGR